DMVHVPYRGGGPAVTDLIAGQVQVYFATTVSSIEYVRTGRLRALAGTTAARSEAPPDIPTVAEVLPGSDANGWVGLRAPEGHAGRNHRHAQQGDQRGSRRSQDESAAR